jgi:hypothetical protein
MEEQRCGVVNLAVPCCDEVRRVVRVVVYSKSAVKPTTGPKC